MMKMKKFMAVALSAVMIAGSGSVLSTEAASNITISRVGNKNRTTYVGRSLDLEVREGSALRDSDMKWTIGNTSVLAFEDGDRYGDDVEVIAKKTGTTTVTCKNLRTGGKLTYNVTVKKSSGTISRVGSSTRSVSVGNELDLAVRKNGSISDSKIKWSVGNSTILAFEDSDRYGDDMEFKAKKAGTTTVTVKNLLTGGSLKFTVTVKKASGTISRVGSSTRSVYVNDELDLAVRKNGSISDNKIKWSVADSTILAFEDSDRYDDDMEFRARKAGTTTVTAKNLLTGGSLKFTVTVKKAPTSYTISRVGSSSRTEELDDDFELNVKKSSALSSSQIKWTIANTRILRFEDGDNYGTEVELETLRTGTTTVTATNLKTGGKITYTIKVVPEYDD